MLFKNHVKVSLKNEDLYKKHKDEFESFIKGKSAVVIKTKDIVRINPTGYREPDRTHTVPTQAIIANADGSDNDYWIFSETAPKKEQNGEWKYDLKAIKIEGELSLNPKTDWEKLFFLMYLSTAAKNKRIVVVNEAKEDEAKVDKLKQNSRINFLIMDELSPVDEFTLRRIAKAFGVGNVDTKSTTKVKLELKGVIDVSDTTQDKFRNSEAFVKAINEGEEYDIRAQVQEAIDAGRIKYNEVAAYYYYAGEDGEEIKKIMNIDLLVANDKIRRINALNNYFIVNADKRTELSRLLNYSVDDIDLSKAPYTVLKRWASMHGCSGKGTLEELLPRCIEFYAQNRDKIKFNMDILAIAQEQPTE